MDFWSEEIPSMYEKLLFGRWDDFIVSDEIEAFEDAHEEYSVSAMKLTYRLHNTPEYQAKFSDEVELEGNELKDALNWVRQKMIEIRKDSPRYDEYFNKDWVASRQIQGLIWYKEFLKKVIR